MTSLQDQYEIELHDTGKVIGINNTNMTQLS